MTNQHGVNQQVVTSSCEQVVSLKLSNSFYIR